MTGLLLALTGLAILDSLSVLNIGVVSAVVYGSRLNRQSALPGGLSFIAGVFTVTSIFGLCTVLGLGFLTDLTNFELTPTVRYWGELLIGLALIALAYFPLVSQTPAPGWANGLRPLARRDLGGTAPGGWGEGPGRALGVDAQHGQLVA